MSNEESKELTREERVTLATTMFGLYMMPMYLSDAKAYKERTGSDGQLIDIDCAMDNSRVPFYRDQLTDKMKEVLEGHKALMQATTEQPQPSTRVESDLIVRAILQCDLIKGFIVRYRDDATVERLYGKLSDGSREFVVHDFTGDVTPEQYRHGVMKMLNDDRGATIVFLPNPALPTNQIAAPLIRAITGEGIDYKSSFLRAQFVFTGKLILMCKEGFEYEAPIANRCLVGFAD